MIIARTTKLVPPAKSMILGQRNNVVQIVRRTGQLVKFERECDGKEEKLVSDGD